MRPKSVSLIVTTYNWPKALELVLLSIKTQSVLPNEVIIADDGSKQETRELIARYQKSFPIPLIHSWQEDLGFRLARSRNLAIAKSESDYIIMIDGDMILHRHFIRDHKLIAKPNYFVQGRRVILSELFTQMLFENNKTKISLFNTGVQNKLNAISCRLLAPIATKFLSKNDYSSVRGCNMAYWRNDVISINGYNEDFVGWGREDSEFVVRLLNNHIIRQDLRFGGVAYHLYHHENSRHNLDDNDQLLKLAVKNSVHNCEHGLNQYLIKNKQSEVIND
ncbi:glycosyltransferase family 2 protein [Orbus sturtevantii]|uniref:glycosyltransferase family 2 protein n=1 Tax=Orbus sturtevantii TaxID=3074109 RepID=UPI00370D444E